MTNRSDNSRRVLQLLVSEMRVTLQLLQGQAHMHVTTTEKRVAVLRKIVSQLADKIYNSTQDAHLKAVVNSVFDTLPADFIFKELQAFNRGDKPEWYAQVSDD